MNVLINPDCRDGKHASCSGGWNDDTDTPDNCPCTCHTPEKCETCSGHGVIGGLTPYGYDCAECPTCDGIGTHTEKEPS